jgi:hypothetical protein
LASLGWGEPRIRIFPFRGGVVKRTPALGAGFRLRSYQSTTGGE